MIVLLAGALLSALVPGVASAQDKVVGDWHGTLEVSGASLPVVFHIRDTNGTLTATLDSPNQGAYGVAVGRVAFESRLVELEVAAVGGGYEGTLQEDGTIVGRWSQGGATVDLTLEQRKEAAAEGLPKAATYELSDAVLAGDVEKVRASIAGGADIHFLDTRPTIAGGNGRRPLNFAALGNDVRMIETLLELGADINRQNLSGFTPLHHAVEAQSVEAIAFLVSRGADATIKNSRGLTPEGLAGATGRTRAAAALAQATAKSP